MKIVQHLSLLAVGLICSSFAFKPCFKACFKPTCRSCRRRAPGCKKTWKKQLFKPNPAPLLLAPLLPVAGFYGIMSAPIYGKGLLPGTGGLLDFSTLEKRMRPNEYLAFPEEGGLCPKFKGSGTSGGGGGGASTGLSPVFEGVAEAELQEVFLETIKDLYVLQAFAEPTLSKADTRQFVFVQRTKLLRFPDVINVQFLNAAVAGAGEGSAVTPASTLIIHSASVFGFDDLGTNRKRVEDLLARVEDAVQEKAVTKARQQGNTSSDGGGSVGASDTTASEKSDVGAEAGEAVEKAAEAGIQGAGAVLGAVEEEAASDEEAVEKAAEAGTQGAGAVLDAVEEEAASVEKNPWLRSEGENPWLRSED